MSRHAASGIAVRASVSADELPARRLFSVDEYYRMAEAGILDEDERVELIEGEIIQMPPIGSPHGAGTDRLAQLFVPRLASRAQVRIQGPVRLSAGSEPVPDLALLRPRADFYAEAHPGPQDVLLLIEVSDSSLRYDRGRKLALYAASGIPEVWILDLRGKRIFVNREFKDGAYSETATLRRGDTLAPSAFPDLSLNVSDLLG